jgi:hypothetical protein
MSRLEIKVDGDDVAADKMLRVATRTLKTLKDIEKQICQEQGIKPSIRWRVDMMSGFSYGLIALSADYPRDASAEDKRFQNLAWAEAMEKLKQPGAAA